MESTSLWITRLMRVNLISFCCRASKNKHKLQTPAEKKKFGASFKKGFLIWQTWNEAFKTRRDWSFLCFSLRESIFTLSLCVVKQHNIRCALNSSNAAFMAILCLYIIWTFMIFFCNVTTKFHRQWMWPVQLVQYSDFIGLMWLHAAFIYLFIVYVEAHMLPIRNSTKIDQLFFFSFWQWLKN